MSFWTWAVKVYRGDGVADACLALQDEDGQNVPLLLWATWRAVGWGALSESQVHQATALAQSWSDELIVPLRLLRRRLKTELSTDDEALRLPLREKIKTIELEAERALMTRLATLEKVENASLNHEVKGLTLANLQSVAHAWKGQVSQSRLLRLTEALSDGGFLQYKL